MPKNTAETDARFVYAGYFIMDDKKEGGIGFFEYDAQSGEAKYLKTIREDLHPGVLCVDRKRRVLYAVDERKGNPELDWKGGGRVYAFSIDPESGELSEINHRFTFGSMPCYLTLDEHGEHLLVSHFSDAGCSTHISKDVNGEFHLSMAYSDSPITVFPLAEDGSIGKPCDVMVVPQAGKEFTVLHSIQRSPKGQLFMVCVRSQCKLLLLKLDEEHKLHQIGSIVYPGSKVPKSGYSPRYGVFHPTKDLYYFNNEFMTNITTVRYSEEGTLETVLSLDAAPQLPNLDGVTASMSDLKISVDGAYLYALYRGVNAIGVFKLDEESGLPAMIQSLKLEGDNPRGMQISPDGRFILVANMLSEDIETLAVQPDGTVVKTGARAFGHARNADIAFF